MREPDAMPTDPPVDGRTTRWDDHREARRTSLVAAAVAAIDHHGPDASIAQIAAAAGVSRPVLYRYFDDKDDLYRAVGQWGADQVLALIMKALTEPASVRKQIYHGCAAYLSFIEKHPQVFFLLTEHRSADPLSDGKERIAATFARVMGDTLRDLGLDSGGAEPWARGIIGLGLAVGEWWLRRRSMSRTAATDYLASFIWHGFNGFVQDNGARIDQSGHLELIARDGS